MEIDDPEGCGDYDDANASDGATRQIIVAGRVTGFVGISTCAASGEAFFFLLYAHSLRRTTSVAMQAPCDI